jgi:cation diffusion facilitator CzcD-associated flavoprotein CzcO
METPALETLAVAVIGGGPVGLAAAAHFLACGVPVKVYEAGSEVGSNVRDWGHVRVFTPWRYCVDQAATKLLKHHGWRLPAADHYPTGAELLSDYLEPLAATPESAAVIETNTRVTRDLAARRRQSREPRARDAALCPGGGIEERRPP